MRRVNTSIIIEAVNYSEYESERCTSNVLVPKTFAHMIENNTRDATDH